jgi:hypothetical protein
VRVGGISIPGLLSGLAMRCCLISPMGTIDLGSQGILVRIPRIARKARHLQNTAMCVRTLFRLVPRLGTAGAGGTQSPSQVQAYRPFSCMSAGTTGGLLWGVFRSAPHSVGSVQRSLLILLYTYLPTSSRSYI